MKNDRKRIFRTRDLRVSTSKDLHAQAIVSKIALRRAIMTRVTLAILSVAIVFATVNSSAAADLTSTFGLEEAFRYSTRSLDNGRQLN